MYGLAARRPGSYVPCGQLYTEFTNITDERYGVLMFGCMNYPLHPPDKLTSRIIRLRIISPLTFSPSSSISFSLISHFISSLLHPFLPHLSHFLTDSRRVYGPCSPIIKMHHFKHILTHGHKREKSLKIWKAVAKLNTHKTETLHCSLLSQTSLHQL